MTPVRPSSRLALAALVAALAALGCLLHAGAQRAEARRADSAALAAGLGLTDLALFTEAAYTRFPALGDRLAPFLDHPQAREHFPSGAILAPPAAAPAPARREAR